MTRLRLSREVAQRKEQRDAARRASLRERGEGTLLSPRAALASSIPAPEALGEVDESWSR